jgi:Tol biopolymer transport system component
LTFDPTGNYSPIWTPDGQHLIYGSPRERGADIGNLYRRAAVGGSEVRLTDSDRQHRANAITVDGTLLIFEEQTPQRDYDFKILSLANPTEPKPLLQTPFDERDAEISPDGRWLAYDSNESGRLPVYVRPFPNVADVQYQISTDGGRSPAWSPKGGELYYVSGTSMMRVTVDMANGSFRAGNPTRLFDAPSLALDGRFSLGGTLRTYDVAPDGQRFLAIRLSDGTDEGAAPDATLVVVQNWVEEVKAKLAAR